MGDLGYSRPLIDGSPRPHRSNGQIDISTSRRPQTHLIQDTKSVTLIGRASLIISSVDLSSESLWDRS